MAEHRPRDEASRLQWYEGIRLKANRGDTMKVAVVNCGSSSIKYEVFSVPDHVMLATGLIEKIGSDEGRLRQRRRAADGTFDEQVYSKRLTDHRDGFEFMADVNREDRIIRDEGELLGIGHRVVHGGELFREPTLIDDDVVAAIRSLIPLAPLHNPSNLLGIEVARTRFPGTPQVAVFDTAFHQTLPPHAFHYAVPYDWYTNHHVRRYGFHGTSHLYVSREAAGYLGKAAGGHEPHHAPPGQRRQLRGRTRRRERRHLDGPHPARRPGHGHEVRRHRSGAPLLHHEGDGDVGGRTGEDRSTHRAASRGSAG